MILYNIAIMIDTAITQEVQAPNEPVVARPDLKSVLAGVAGSVINKIQDVTISAIEKVVEFGQAVEGLFANHLEVGERQKGIADTRVVFGLLAVVGLVFLLHSLGTVNYNNIVYSLTEPNRSVISMGKQYMYGTCYPTNGNTFYATALNIADRDNDLQIDPDPLLVLFDDKDLMGNGNYRLTTGGGIQQNGGATAIGSEAPEKGCVAKVTDTSDVIFPTRTAEPTYPPRPTAVPTGQSGVPIRTKNGFTCIDLLGRPLEEVLDDLGVPTLESTGERYPYLIRTNGGFQLATTGITLPPLEEIQSVCQN